ncbi:hypothetical protein EUTSA_v10012359mg [Eutrema salsugineum]|uniref:F-box domain-containing protein n=1 Tax=Eutrema salsugineum TaxID=72664 RepID=V4KJH1_EUTSA|nr:hypothetical protein EUTSA_v10012359mg [Eutrema salsugineum]
MKKLKQNVSGCSDQIPVDLLIEIFLRVSSKSIVRFRCVSKFWRSLLRRPNFTELFLTKSLARPLLLFAFQVGDGKLVFYTSLHTTNPNKRPSLDFVDRHGLICRHEQRKTQSMAMICNPITGESITLPEVRMERIDKRSYFIGYDPIKKQFKVLCMTWYYSKVHNIPQEHRVMTLGNGKHIWRKTKCCRPHYPLDNVICFNGVLYYCSGSCGLSSNSAVTMIVCFDVRSEIFSFIDKDEAMSIYYSCTLINYKGKLGVAKFTYGFHRFLELWILEDAGKHKWSKIIYEFSPLWKSIFDETSVHIIGLTGTGDIVFSAYFLSDPFYVFYYNLDSKTLTRTEIQGFEKFQNHRVYIFQEYVENVKPNLLT